MNKQQQHSYTAQEEYFMSVATQLTDMQSSK